MLSTDERSDKRHGHRDGQLGEDQAQHGDMAKDWSMACRRTFRSARTWIVFLEAA